MANIGVLILAAGQGKRMHSIRPKVLHEVSGDPLIFHVLKQVHDQFNGSPIGIVVGHGRQDVETAIKGDARFSHLDIEFIFQSSQRGTGDAARVAMESDWGKKRVASNDQILVLPGDLPLITKEMLKEAGRPLKNSVMSLLTTSLKDPTGYGRVIRKSKSIQKIVEERDLKSTERKISEVAVSIYLFSAPFLAEGVGQLNTKNSQGEYYLTDVLAYAIKKKKKVSDVFWKNSEDLRGVNDPWELSMAAKISNEKILKGWAKKGITFLDPVTTWVDSTVELASGVTIYPGTLLKGKTKIGKGSVIGPHCFLTDMQIGENVSIKTGTVGEKSKIEDGANVGPYAHLRPESVVGANSKIGNFVELKKTKIGSNTSVAHLSYLGDAEVGKNVNIGCGFVTCNYDGRVINGERKHKTLIEDDVFLGSDCQTVAPVQIGKGAYVASGSTITENVEAGSLAIARSRQVNKAGYAKKLKGSS
jgi:bifunctional UDP-N-acetylglucosamine pyrophosphorylase/glucosamine-1-phosphate N-acetyltransferase